MSTSRRRQTAGASRRTFLKAAAGVTAGTVLGGRAFARQLAEGAAAGRAPRIDPRLMISPEQALEWNLLKAQCGPTYAGSAGWKTFTDFLLGKMPQSGAVDLDYVDIPYDHYIVDDWPDRRTHLHDSGMALEKLVSDDKPVPVVASYGMTSGFTPPEGVTAQMLYYDSAKPPAAEEIAGKILVFQTAPYPDPP